MKAIASILFLFCSCAVFAQEHEEEENLNHHDNHHCRMEERSVTVGLAAPYSIHLNTVGANLRMYYNATEQLCLGPEYSYFLSGDAEIVDFDLVVHYIFETPWIGIYPLVGANYTVETEEEHTIRETHAALGVVFGAGMHRNFGHFTAFAEYARVELGVADQFVTAGLMYSFE